MHLPRGIRPSRMIAAIILTGALAIGGVSSANAANSMPIPSASPVAPTADFAKQLNDLRYAEYKKVTDAQVAAGISYCQSLAKTAQGSMQLDGQIDCYNAIIGKLQLLQYIAPPPAPPVHK